MFESKERLAEEIRGLLEAFRGLADARYACLMEPRGIVFESPEPQEAAEWTLRRFLEERSAAIFTIPEAMASGGPGEDVFEGWEHDEFFLAFINRRVVLVVACPDGEEVRERAMEPLKALADRLFRYNETYRMDPQGRGFFFGSAKLDLVVVGRNPQD